MINSDFLNPHQASVTLAWKPSPFIFTANELNGFYTSVTWIKLTFPDRYLSSKWQSSKYSKQTAETQE